MVNNVIFMSFYRNLPSEVHLRMVKEIKINIYFSYFENIGYEYVNNHQVPV